MNTKVGITAIAGLCLIVSSVILGGSLYYSRSTVRTVKVVGAATKRFGSDIVKWRVMLARNTYPEGVREGYESIRQDLRSFEDMLVDSGVDKDDLVVQPANLNPTYNSEGKISGYSITQNMYIISKDVDKIEKLALDPGTLADRGIFLQFSNLEFYSSELSEIKKELLAAATIDARRRAEKMAKSSGSTIKYIISAKAGVFQITEPYSTEISDYGINNTSTKEKDITVTANVEFAIK